MCFSYVFSFLVPPPYRLYKYKEIKALCFVILFFFLVYPVSFISAQRYAAPETMFSSSVGTSGRMGASTSMRSTSVYQRKSLSSGRVGATGSALAAHHKVEESLAEYNQAQAQRRGVKPPTSGEIGVLSSPVGDGVPVLLVLAFIVLIIRLSKKKGFFLSFN